MKYVTLILILAFPTAVFAGGTASEVDIKDLKIQNDKFVLTFSFVNTTDKDSYSGCEKIVVSGDYDEEKWSTYKGRPMSLELHKRSIAALLQARTKGKTVWFGEFGQGLRQKSECDYISKGLFTENGFIFSIFQNI